MPYDVSREDRDEEREQNGVDLGWLRIRGVEPESEEADGSVEDLSRDFVSVNLETVSFPLFAHVLGRARRTNDRHSWWMGIRPSGLGLRLRLRQYSLFELAVCGER